MPKICRAQSIDNSVLKFHAKLAKSSWFWPTSWPIPWPKPWLNTNIFEWNQHYLFLTDHIHNPCNLSRLSNYLNAKVNSIGKLKVNTLSGKCVGFLNISPYFYRLEIFPVIILPAVIFPNKFELENIFLFIILQFRSVHKNYFLIFPVNLK